MLKRILVGLGGTDYTVAAINQAVAMAMANDAEVTGVSILDKERLSGVGPVPIGGGYYAHDLAEHRLTKAKDRIEWAMPNSPRRAVLRTFGIECCARWANHSR